MFKTFTDVVTTGLLTIGILAFIVSVIIEVIKETTLLKKIPTDIVVIVLSIVLTIISYFILSDIKNLKIVWFEVIGAFVGGFFVAFVAMFGWEKLNALLKRFIKENKPLE